MSFKFQVEGFKFFEFGGDCSVNLKLET